MCLLLLLFQLFSKTYLVGASHNNDPNVVLLSYLLAILINNGKYMHTQYCGLAFYQPATRDFQLLMSLPEMSFLR